MFAYRGGTRGAPIMPRDAVSRTANVGHNGGHKWVNHLKQENDPTPPDPTVTDFKKI